MGVVTSSFTSRVGTGLELGSLLGLGTLPCRALTEENATCNFCCQPHQTQAGFAACLPCIFAVLDKGPQLLDRMSGVHSVCQNCRNCQNFQKWFKWRISA